MALPISDTFTGGAATLADPPYFNMRSGTSAMVLDGSGNAKSDSTGRDTLVYDDSNTYNADQSSAVTLGADLTSGDGFVFVIVRATGVYASGSWYWFYSDGHTVTAIDKVVGGSGSTLVSDGTFTCGNGDVIEFRATGTSTTSLKIFKNGVEYAPLTITDSSSPITSGSAGFGAEQSTDNVRITAWTGDNVTSDLLMPQVCI